MEIPAAHDDDPMPLSRALRLRRREQRYLPSTIVTCSCSGFSCVSSRFELRYPDTHGISTTARIRPTQVSHAWEKKQTLSPKFTPAICNIPLLFINRHLSEPVASVFATSSFSLLPATPSFPQPEPEPGFDTTGAFGKGSPAETPTDFSVVDFGSWPGFSSGESSVAADGGDSPAALSSDDALGVVDSFGISAELSLLQRDTDPEQDDSSVEGEIGIEVSTSRVRVTHQSRQWSRARVGGSWGGY